MFTRATALRFPVEAEFLMHVESNFFSGMKRLICARLGARALLFGSGEHNDGLAGYAHIRNSLPFDVIDGHGHWQPPDLGQVTRSASDPMVNAPLDASVTRFARRPVAGRRLTRCSRDKVIAVKATPLRAAGCPLAPPEPAARAAGDWTLKPGEPVTTGWRVEVQQ